MFEIADPHDMFATVVVDFALLGPAQKFEAFGRDAVDCEDVVAKGRVWQRRAARAVQAIDHLLPFAEAFMREHGGRPAWLTDERSFAFAIDFSESPLPALLLAEAFLPLAEALAQVDAEISIYFG